jgi:hypothetical protein
MVQIGRRQLRFSYGYEETSRLQEAIGYIAEATAYARGVQAAGLLDRKVAAG